MRIMQAGRSMAGWALALGLGIALTPSAARTEELTKFTGYTRPGIPTGPAGALKGADGGALGATVYFKVFELGGDGGDDPWGTGFANLESMFVPGQASRGRNIEKLDTTARYLYLYQVVNDSYREGQVKSAAIRLLVPPHLITSWGHFAEKRARDDGRGAGFAMEFNNPDPKNPKLKSMLLPMSTDHPGVSDDLYRNPAPYFNAASPYSLANIRLNNKPAPLTDGEDAGREPERVVLQSMVNFEGAPIWLTKDRTPLPLSPFTRLVLPHSDLANPYYSPFSPLMPPGMGAPLVAPGLAGAAGKGPVNLTEALRRAPAVVAYWTDNPLLPGTAGVRPGQRSTLFGFTSNFPPVYEDVRVRGNTPQPLKAPAAPAPDARAANLLADGEVPTPVAFEQCPPPLGHAPGSLGGLIGQIGAGGSLLRGGGGFGGGGFGFGFGGGGLGTGGGGGGMSGGGGSSTPTQAQAQTPAAVTVIPFPVSNSQTLTNANTAIAQQSQAQAQAQTQQQQQQQQQQQHQQQHQHGHHGRVVPEPTALVPALLGVPVLLLLMWRRKTAPAAA